MSFHRVVSKAKNKTSPKCEDLKSSHVKPSHVAKKVSIGVKSSAKAAFSKAFKLFSLMHRRRHPYSSNDVCLHDEETEDVFSIRNMYLLPYEIQCAIFSHFDTADRVSLLLSCRQFYACDALSRSTHNPSSPAEKLNVMRRIGRDSPLVDHWLCSSCTRFHRAHVQDVPTTGELLDTDIILPECCRDQEEQDLYTPLRSYRLSHRHTSLALRYHALKANSSEALTRDRADRLDHFLSPHHTTCWLGFRVGRGFETLHSTFPNIVNGRFMLCTVVVDQVPDHMTYRIGDTAFMFVCKHLGVRDREDPRTSHFCDLEHTYNRQSATQHPPCCEYWKDLLKYASQRAVDEPGFEFRGSCVFCPTDFSVLRIQHPQALLYRSWQDLGTIDDLPSSHLKLAMNWKYSGPETAWHEAGSVRAAYGPGFDDAHRLLHHLQNETPSLSERKDFVGSNIYYPEEGHNYWEWIQHRPQSREGRSIERYWTNRGIPQKRIERLWQDNTKEAYLCSSAGRESAGSL